MDFTALRYFCETANSRSIRAASERLHISPSAISRQIAKLEYELRTPVFDRRSQGMALTAAGEILQTKVEGMMREFERVKSHVAALQNLQMGTVDIYGFQAAAESILMPEPLAETSVALQAGQTHCGCSCALRLMKD